MGVGSGLAGVARGLCKGAPLVSIVGVFSTKTVGVAEISAFFFFSFTTASTMIMTSKISKTAVAIVLYMMIPIEKNGL